MNPKVVRRIDELHEWHNKNDEDGVKLWYLPNWLRRMFEDIHKTQATQVMLLEKMTESQADVIEVLKELIKEIKHERD